VQKKLKDRHMEIKKEINDRFRKFERIIDLRVTHHKNIKERVDNFTKRLDKAENLMESHDLDFKTMFEIFFEKGPKNAFEEIEKISQEIEIEKNNNSNFVEKELSKYKLEYEQTAINNFLKNNLIRLICEVNSVGESLRNVTSLGNSYDRNFYSKTPDKKKIQNMKIMKIIKFEKEDSFENKLTKNINLSKDLDLMGSNFDSKIFSNINMCEFIKKNQPEQNLLNSDEFENENIFMFPTPNDFSKTERKKQKKANIEINFSEKKQNNEGNQIREEEIDKINNSTSSRTESVFNNKAKNGSISKEGVETSHKMMSFLDDDDEDENLMSSSIQKTSKSSFVNDCDISFTPKKEKTICFDQHEEELIIPKDLMNKKKAKFMKQASNSDVNFFNKAEKLMKRRNHSNTKTMTSTNDFLPNKSKVLTEINFNRIKESNSTKNMKLRSTLYEEDDPPNLNLYNRYSTKVEPLYNKRVKNKMSHSNFVGLASSENLYKEKSNNLSNRGKRLKRQGSQSTSAAESNLRLSRKFATSSRKIIDLRKRRNGSKSINEMTSINKLNKKSLRIKTENSQIYDRG
jgi:hypothetical protein